MGVVIDKWRGYSYVRIYNRALSEAEVEELYNLESRLPVTDGLVAYYPFNGNPNDESGNGNHGAAIGTTTSVDRFGSPNASRFFNGTSDYIEIPSSHRSGDMDTGWAIIHG